MGLPRLHTLRTPQIELFQDHTYDDLLYLETRMPLHVLAPSYIKNSFPYHFPKLTILHLHLHRCDPWRNDRTPIIHFVEHVALVTKILQIIKHYYFNLNELCITAQRHVIQVPHMDEAILKSNFFQFGYLPKLTHFAGTFGKQTKSLAQKRKLNTDTQTFTFKRHSPIAGWDYTPKPQPTQRQNTFRWLHDNPFED